MKTEQKNEKRTKANVQADCRTKRLEKRPEKERSAQPQPSGGTSAGGCNFRKRCGKIPAVCRSVRIDGACAAGGQCGLGGCQKDRSRNRRCSHLRERWKDSDSSDCRKNRERISHKGRRQPGGRQQPGGIRRSGWNGCVPPALSGLWSPLAAAIPDSPSGRRKYSAGSTFSAPGRKDPEKQQEKKKNEQFRWPAAAEKNREKGKE